MNLERNIKWRRKMKKKGKRKNKQYKIKNRMRKTRKT